MTRAKSNTTKQKSSVGIQKQVAMEEDEDGCGQMENLRIEEQQATGDQVKKKEEEGVQRTGPTVEAMSPEVEAELLDLVVSIVNVTSTFNIGCKLNLVELVVHGVNVEMKVGAGERAIGAAESIIFIQ